MPLSLLGGMIAGSLAHPQNVDHRGSLTQRSPLNCGRYGPDAFDLEAVNAALKAFR